MSEESWRPIPGFEGEYEVSDQGRVRSLDRIVMCCGPEKGMYESVKKGKILSCSTQKRGSYQTLPIKGKTFKVHSLVLLAFVGPRPKDHDVCHIDGDARNNNLSNLKYGLRSENNYDCAIRDGFRVTREQVQFAKKSGASGRKVAAYLGISETHVRNIRSKARIYG